MTVLGYKYVITIEFSIEQSVLWEGEEIKKSPALTSGTLNL
jgi:hypothetical protein